MGTLGLYRYNSPPMLDIFALRNQIIDDYHCYIKSFLNIKDPKVRGFVHEELVRGELWQDPLIQLNPAYQKGASISELIAQNTLHPDCGILQTVKYWTSRARS